MEEIQVKPFSKNPVLAFFQSIWRRWLGAWYSFADKHEKGAKLIYRIFFFIVFCEGVTIFQLLVFQFMPMMLGQGLAGMEVLWPACDVTLFGYTFKYSMFGDIAQFDQAGNAIIGGGLGYTIAYWTGTFLAQCINFPLQRNITYKSKGNPWYQAMWYFIGWVLLSAVTGAFKGLWKPLLTHQLGAGSFVITLIDTVVMGGISMTIFFFIFLVIFPDRQKQAENAKKRLERIKTKGVSEDKISAYESKVNELIKIADADTKRKDIISAKSSLQAKALAWDIMKKKAEKAKQKGNNEDYESLIKIADENYQKALELKAHLDELETA